MKSKKKQKTTCYLYRKKYRYQITSILQHNLSILFKRIRVRGPEITKVVRPWPSPSSKMAPSKKRFGYFDLTTSQPPPWFWTPQFFLVFSTFPLILSQKKKILPSKKFLDLENFSMFFWISGLETNLTQSNLRKIT